MILENSYSVVIITAISAGFFAFLTPCVLPMIPITITYFLKRNEENGYRRYIEPLFFVFNIVICFTVIGSFLSIIFGAAFLQSFASNPYWNFIIGVIFILFSLHLFGFINFSATRLLQFLQNIYHKIEQNHYILSNFLLAFIFSITTFTCAVPFIGTLLVSLSIASTSNLMLPIVGMLVFSFVFSIPFLILSFFPTFLKKIPNYQKWLQTLMASMGFIELMFAFKFFSNADIVLNLQLISRSTLLFLWSSIIFMWFFYLLKIYTFQFDELEEKNQKSVKRLGASQFFFYLSVLFLALYLFYCGITNKKVFLLEPLLPPVEYAIGGNQNIGLVRQKSKIWHTNLDTALQIAEEENKLVFVDFTGFTCTNCRWMEANIFSNDEIQKKFNNFVLVKLYTDGLKQEYQDNQKFLQNTLNTVAIPTYIIMDSQKEIVRWHQGIERDVQKFRKFL